VRTHLPGLFSSEPLKGYYYIATFMPLTVLGDLLATMKGTTKEWSPVVVTAVAGQAKPFDFRQLLDCKATRSVYQVDLHTPDTVRDIWLRGQRTAGVGHRVMGPLGASRPWYLPPTFSLFESLGRRSYVCTSV
jgi:hypothetical protein